MGEITGSTGEGKIRTYIHEVFPFERIQDAHRTMQAYANAYVSCWRFEAVSDAYETLFFLFVSGKLIVTIP